MSTESTFIPLAFEWDRDARSYKKAFRITDEEEKKAAILIWEAKKADLASRPQDVVLDAIADGRLSGNFAACLLQIGADTWWNQTSPGVYAILGSLEELPDD